MKHFLKETDFSIREAADIFSLAQKYKNNRGENNSSVLNNQSWALLFYKSSTRTRVSFEVGINELGGHALHLDKDTMQLSRGESVADTAKILSRYCHGLVIRAYEHEIIEEFAREGTISVVNALTDFLHPCQIFSDAFTLAERWSEDCNVTSLKDRKIVFIGDCNCNMANSWILGGHLFSMNVTLVGPEAFAPGDQIKNYLDKAGIAQAYTFTTDIQEAVEDADVIYTDVWVSMGKEDEEAMRAKKLSPYKVTLDLLNAAKEDALFMHCLPAHLEMEVSPEVYHNPKSIVFDQAENRLHVQKAILSSLAGSDKS